MESVNEIKEALSARSRTATLDELRNEGRKRVRLIRAEHVASMISEAVHAAIEASDLIPPEDVEKLVERSRQEFKAILIERERELQRAHDTEHALAERERELSEVRQQLEEVTASLAASEQALSEAQAALGRAREEAARARDEAATATAAASAEATSRREFEAEAARQRAAAGAAAAQLVEANQAVAAARAVAAEAAAAAQAARIAPAPVAAPAAQGMSPDLLMSLVQEMATLKANLMQQKAGTPAVPAAAAMPDFTAALEKLTGSLNDRLEKLGKKMGVSAAVESDAPVDFGGLFKDTGKSLESNMENIEVKQKAGGGIAANLARLKKLKGGG